MSGTGTRRLRPSNRDVSVGILTYSTRPRGSVVCAASLAGKLDAFGVEVTLYALDKGEGGFYRALDCPLKLIPTAAAPTQSRRLIAQRIFETQRFLQEQAPQHDVLHVQDCLVANGALKARSHGYCPLVLRTVHHLERFEDEYLSQCQRRSILDSDALVAVSETTRREVESEFGRPCPVIHNGVDATRLSRESSPDAWTALAERVGLPAARYLLSVGGIESRKNSLTQLEAFIRVSEQQPDLHWVIVGGASVFDQAQLRAQFWSRAVEAGVRQRILSLGVVSDEELALLYRHCAALLHAANLEGWGLSVVEALAAGAPVVVSRGAPFDEYVDERCAVLVDASSCKSIAAGVLQALHAPAQMLAAGRDRARDFSWHRCATAHLKLYCRLVRSGAAEHTEV